MHSIRCISASRTSHAPKVADICTYICGMRVTSHRTRRPSLDVIERTECAVTTSTSCNGGFRRGKIIATCAGEEPTYFRPPRRQVKTIFSRCTRSRIASPWIFMRATDARKSGIESLTHPPGGISKRHVIWYARETRASSVAPSRALMDPLKSLNPLGSNLVDGESVSRPSRFNCYRLVIMPRNRIAWRNPDEVNFQTWLFHYYRGLSRPRSSSSCYPQKRCGGRY